MINTVKMQPQHENPIDFVSNWKQDFVSRIKETCNSKKQDFCYSDALNRGLDVRTALDRVMIDYLEFINSQPLKSNDFYKYMNAYREGVKLQEKFFKHDLEKLHSYYRKADKDSKYNPFCVSLFERYVLFMMLKLKGVYQPSYDGMFNVKVVGSREYSPLTAIPSVLRATLPFKIKEYDIVQAYPSFTFMELGIEPIDVYSILDKRTYNTLLNTHKGVNGATIEAVRAKLKPIYGDRVKEVITEKRFNTQGQTFEDFSKHEADFINRFVEANNLKNYVRLHDGVVVLDNVECDVLEFENIKFKIKEFSAPEIVNKTVNFYYVDFEGKVHTRPSKYARFFKQEDFIRITREGHDKITILKNKGKIINPINHLTDLVPYLTENINEAYPENVEDRIARDATSTVQHGLLLLDPIKLTYHKDTKYQSDIPFKNGIARITADGMELISYDSKEIGFFTKHQTQEHEISLVDVDENKSDFALFLTMAATGKDLLTDELNEHDRETMVAFYSMFGYLISNYKDPAFSPAIILSDENADGENRNGGRGKSLLQRAVSLVRPTIEKGGNAYDPNYTHVHADLKIEHDVYLIDDVPSGFDYNSLYTNITGAIDCQRKGSTAETIPFEDAPKFVISTNWAVRYDAQATSTNRRFIEYKFSDFWNIDNTPDKYFEKSFFTEWDSNEWNAFYNFCFHCVQVYLKNGIKKIEYDKKADNFRAYFYNDSILQETERIFEQLKLESSFTVTDFITEHKTNEAFRYKPEFTIRNAKKFIDAFIEFYDLEFNYDVKWRRWNRYLLEKVV